MHSFLLFTETAANNSPSCDVFSLSLTVTKVADILKYSPHSKPIQTLNHLKVNPKDVQQM